MASIAAPISATGAVIPVAVGALHGETTSVWQAIGMVLAILGVVLAAWTAGDPMHASPSGRQSRAGTGFALLAAAGFGCFFVLLHDASTYSVVWATFVQRLTSVSVLVFACLIVRPSLAVGWRPTPRLLAIGALDQGANLLYGFASTVGLVSLAAVLASLFPVGPVSRSRWRRSRCGRRHQPMLHGPGGDRLLLATLWATGERISEVLALRLRDVRRQGLVLPNLKNPSRPVKTAHLAAAHAGLPGDLLLWAREHDLDDDEPLFFSRQRGADAQPRRAG